MTKKLKIQSFNNIKILNKTVITGTLKSKIDQIWQTFYEGGVTNTITVVEQTTNLPNFHQKFR